MHDEPEPNPPNLTPLVPIPGSYTTLTESTGCSVDVDFQFKFIRVEIQSTVVVGRRASRANASSSSTTSSPNPVLSLSLSCEWHGVVVVSVVLGCTAPRRYLTHWQSMNLTSWLSEIEIYIIWMRFEFYLYEGGGCVLVMVTTFVGCVVCILYYHLYRYYTTMACTTTTTTTTNDDEGDDGVVLPYSVFRAGFDSILRCTTSELAGRGSFVQFLARDLFEKTEATGGGVSAASCFFGVLNTWGSAAACNTRSAYEMSPTG